ncbi:MAG: VWA domain-containing protein [Actinomycetes bacterium]
MSGFRYGPFHDGPDPLAGPLDAGAGVDDLAKRIMDGQSVEDALRDLMREGTQGRRGMRDMARQVRDKRRRLEKSGAMDGLLQDLRELVEQAKDTERRELFPDPSDDARFREAQLDNIPDDVGRAMQQLANYDWRSNEARALFEQAQERLRRDVVDQQFRNLSNGIDNLPQERQALQQMMQDLNALLDTHRRGEATQADYDAFIDKHRQFFPDAPATLDELIDDLARRQAAMQRMLDSMSPEQRAELQDAMAQAMQDMGLTEQMAALQQNLQSLRPEFGPSSKARMSGSQRMGLPQVTDALAELSDLEALDSSLNDGFNRMDLDDIDEEAIERALGRQARDDLEALRELQRQLEEQGYLVNDGDRLELTPKAIRRIGRTALRQVFSSLDGTTRGQHDITRSGASGEFTGSSREWTFGSEQPIDVVRTVRRAMSRRMVSGGDTLMADDFEVHETETTTRAAVALLIDQSFSMVVNDTWRQAKTMALALHTLASTAYPLDAMQIIAFANVARVVQPHELPDLEASHIQGTNLHHALMLAGRFLDSHPGAQRIVMVVTDGEPTARLMPEGYGWFSYPPEDETIAETIAQVDRMTRRRVPISWFRLGDDPSLERFLDGMARRNGGRVLAASADRLGDYVVSDYVRTRRATR